MRTPHIEAAHHLQLRPGTNVAVVNAMAHVVVDRGPRRPRVRGRALRPDDFAAWDEFIARPENSPGGGRGRSPGVPADRAARRRPPLRHRRRNAAIYYGLGVTEHSQGSTMVMGMANLAMATGNIGRDGVGVNPLRGQNNVQGSCDMGSFPHELPGYRHVSDDAVRELFEAAVGRDAARRARPAHPQHVRRRHRRLVPGLFVQGEDIAQSDPNTTHVTAALAALDLRRRAGPVPQRDRAKFAHVFLPGTSFLEKDGTFTNAERRINRVRPVMAAEDRQARVGGRLRASPQAMGYPMHYDDAAADHGRDRRARRPPSPGVSFAQLDEVGSVQWPCNDAAPTARRSCTSTASSAARAASCRRRTCPPTSAATRRFPLHAHDRPHPVASTTSAPRPGAPPTSQWHAEDVLEIHAARRRGARHQRRRLGRRWPAGSARRRMRARITDRMPPGVVYTTFHHPVSGANVVTTEHSDWATNCPEYKVTAVQVALATARAEAEQTVDQVPVAGG